MELTPITPSSPSLPSPSGLSTPPVPPKNSYKNFLPILILLVFGSTFIGGFIALSNSSSSRWDVVSNSDSHGVEDWSEILRSRVFQWCEGSDTRAKIIELAGPIEQWNTTLVTSFKNIFRDCKCSTIDNDHPNTCDPDLGNWDTSNVVDMSHAFQNNHIFTGKNLEKWDVSNVVGMSNIFDHCYGFNGEVGGWNTGKVTKMTKTFYAAEAFERDLSGWDTRNVEYMEFMFAYAKQIEPKGTEGRSYGLQNWDVSKVKYFTGMFNYNDYFNEDISNWDPKEALSMADMFSSAGWADGLGINQDLSGWNVTRVEHFERFLCLANSFSEDNKNKLCEVGTAHKSWIANFCDSGLGWANFPADPCK
ncbi:hypothetical protein TrVE_jg14485 [Triparma verrucosa]|uniref:Uncharacterized protein n=1 Tax=Triparma verrucosa TaxID=1606542 RepID=A0A9W6ZAE5_9STRA|nr:hypothetical protein TrVE_jg14485 [Triparma verrucosa]